MRFRLAQGAIAVAACVVTLLARWPGPPEPEPRPVAAAALPTPPPRPPTDPAVAACAHGQVPREAVAPWEAERERAEDEIARLQGLRAALEGTAPVEPAQDPDALEPALLKAAAGQPEIDLTLESIDCAEYPCVATFRSHETDASFRMDHLMAELHADPAWAHRELGGMHTPLGEGRNVILLAVWEDLPAPEQEAKLHTRMGTMIAHIRSGEP